MSDHLANPDELSESVRLYGTAEALPTLFHLCAGATSLDLEEGAIRSVCVSGIEVLRGIAFVVRDSDWGTYRPLIRDLNVTQQAERFEVTYTAECSDDLQRLEFSVRIVCTEEELSFEAELRPLTPFATNRTGFVVLHPESAAGAPLEVVHVDGTSELSKFPELIAPTQPFFDIRELRHEWAPDAWARCTLEGDAYEMEDQRNWTDASYKTYIRPLAAPRPYVIEQGAYSRQSVRLRLEGGPRVPVTAAERPARVYLDVGQTRGIVPKLGLGVSPELAACTMEAVERLRIARPNLLVARLDLRRHGASDLHALAALSHASELALALEVVLPGEEEPAVELEQLHRQIAAAELELESLALSPAADLRTVDPGTTQVGVPTLESIYRAARSSFGRLRLGGGSFAFFTELNRKRPPLSDLDFVTHTTSAVVHAADDASVMQTLSTLPAVFESARSFIGELPYRIGPSSIAMRQNPYGSSPADNPENVRVAMGERDPRQRGLFGAAFYLGYFAHAAQAGLEAVSFCDATGENGLMPAPEPADDEGDGGVDGVYPVFHVVRLLSAAAGAELLALHNPAPDVVQALAVSGASERTLLVANLSPDAQSVVVRGLGVARAELARMDVASFPEWVRDPRGEVSTRTVDLAEPFELSAYAVATLRIPR